ncbi:MAG: hypothetical protein U9M95_05565 [Candidatus Altiarchaeota archaeon]|nr:hypothetical protein [Candidatus Altiarchaeota archaeon]
MKNKKTLILILVLLSITVSGDIGPGGYTRTDSVAAIAWVIFTISLTALLLLTKGELEQKTSDAMKYAIVIGVFGTLIIDYMYGIALVIAVKICTSAAESWSETKKQKQKINKLKSKMNPGLITILAVIVVVSPLFTFGMVDKLGRFNRGFAGFGAVKPLDHNSSGAGSLDVTFTNGVGARITNVSVGSSDSTGIVSATLTPASADIAPGDNFTAAFNPLLTACPPGAESYDIVLNVSYTNAITHLSQTRSGRVWGPC